MINKNCRANQILEALGKNKITEVWCGIRSYTYNKTSKAYTLFKIAQFAECSVDYVVMWMFDRGILDIDEIDELAGVTKYTFRRFKKLEAQGRMKGSYLTLTKPMVRDYGRRTLTVGKIVELMSVTDDETKADYEHDKIFYRSHKWEVVTVLPEGVTVRRVDKPNMERFLSYIDWWKDMELAVV